MGNPMYTLFCKDCQKKYEIFTGFTHERKLVECFYCTNCKEFHSVKTEENNSKHICQKCNNELIKIEFHSANNESIPSQTTNIQLHCPTCKSENIEIKLTGLWD